MFAFPTTGICVHIGDSLSEATCSRSLCGWIISLEAVSRWAGWWGPASLRRPRSAQPLTSDHINNNRWRGVIANKWFYSATQEKTAAPRLNGKQYWVAAAPGQVINLPIPIRSPVLTETFGCVFQEECDYWDISLHSWLQFWGWVSDNLRSCFLTALLALLKNKYFVQT